MQILYEVVSKVLLGSLSSYAVSKGSDLFNKWLVDPLPLVFGVFCGWESMLKVGLFPVVGDPCSQLQQQAQVAGQ